jgi:prophage tail gpP-like protein
MENGNFNCRYRKKIIVVDHTSLSIEVLKHLADEIQKVVTQNISVEEKIERFRDVFIDVYDYDPNILINLFHLQSGETLKNLSDEVLKQIKTYSSMAHGAIVGRRISAC